MATFHFRVVGRSITDLIASVRAPQRDWMEMEAASFDDARRELAKQTVTTGAVYELRDPDDDGGLER